MKLPLLLSILLSLLLPGAHGQEVREPEAATGLIDKQTVIGHKYMAVTANPYASRTAKKILAAGGSAVDAAIAAQMVLTLVEPQSSGIGGGAFILHWQDKNQQLTTFDGRETAPALATEKLFFDVNDKPIAWLDGVVGGRSVGVPGVLAALNKAHQQYGKLPWNKLFEDAINLAEKGFVVSPRLEKLLTENINPGVKKLPDIYAYFYPNGKQLKAGDVRTNKALAKVFKSIAKQGIDVFYHGWIAEKIVSAVQNATISPGLLTLTDLKNYQAIERLPICGNYLTYKVCGMAPPTSGGVAVIQILKQLERFNLAQFTPLDVNTIHLFSQSSRLAFADRALYIADPDFVTVPYQALVADDYLSERSRLIHLDKDMGIARAGNIKPIAKPLIGKSFEQPSTSHLSIVDSEGNAVSMTTSIEMGFGSAVMVEGFLLNNQLTDFSFLPEKAGQLVANRVQANKRPRSSMAPMMVFNPDGSLKLVVGSPGGSRIINYVAQALMLSLNWQLSPQAVVNLPHITNRNQVTTLEQGTSITEIADELKKKGHEVVFKDLNSGLHMIEVKGKQLLGGADPRREGLVVAE